MTLYIYTTDNNQVVAMITGETNAACERMASELNYDDQDCYAGTYSPAFGTYGGLVMGDNVERHHA